MKNKVAKFGTLPHEFLEMPLASCTAITLQMYTLRKNIPLKYADVKVRITAEGPRNEILREIHFVGTLTDENKKSMILITH